MKCNLHGSRNQSDQAALSRIPQKSVCQRINGNETNYHPKRSTEINGKPATEPFVSGSLHGEQHVTILLGQLPEPPTPPIRPGQ